jgi:hypothetical protein
VQVTLTLPSAGKVIMLPSPELFEPSSDASEVDASPPDVVF